MYKILTVTILKMFLVMRSLTSIRKEDDTEYLQIVLSISTILLEIIRFITYNFFQVTMVGWI